MTPARFVTAVVLGFVFGALFGLALLYAFPPSLPATGIPDGNRALADRLAGSVFIHRFPPPKAG